MTFFNDGQLRGIELVTELRARHSITRLFNVIMTTYIVVFSSIIWKPVTRPQTRKHQNTGHVPPFKTSKKQLSPCRPLCGKLLPFFCFPNLNPVYYYTITHCDSCVRKIPIFLFFIYKLARSSPQGQRCYTQCSRSSWWYTISTSCWLRRHQEQVAILFAPPWNSFQAYSS